MNSIPFGWATCPHLWQIFDVPLVSFFVKYLTSIPSKRALYSIIFCSFLNGSAEYLLQGTIYPDRIESGFRKFSDKIKTHHKVAGLPSKMEFKKVVEPLRDL